MKHMIYRFLPLLVIVLFPPPIILNFVHLKLQKDEPLHQFSSSKLIIIDDRVISLFSIYNMKKKYN